MISNINVPTIAAINGIAFGGGLELALSCDIRVINEQSKIGLTECSLGVIPGAGGTQRLTKIVGLSVAKEMIFCSQKITAKEAYEIGLVNHVSPDEVKTRQKALNIAKKVIQNSSTSIQAAKKAIDLGYNINIRDALKIENNYYLKILSSKDRKEGLLAFKEKRIPVYN
jgi:enoyl-CoA hydratase/carnithine racemase